MTHAPRTSSHARRAALRGAAAKGLRLVGGWLLLALPSLLAPACAGPEVETLRGPWERISSEVADPSLAIDPRGGDLLLAWVGGEGETWHVWFARSQDGGSSWSEPMRVTTAAGQAHPHAEASPRLVAASGDRVAVVWTSSIPIEGRRFPASDLWAASSRDGGRTWSEPTRIHDDAGGAPESHTFHGAAWEGDSTLVVAWLDGRGMLPGHGSSRANDEDTEQGAGHTGDRSTEQGAAQTAEGSTEQRAMRGVDRAASDSAGTARHEHPSESAVWLARSHDFGRTWGSNRALWPSACPCCRVDLARRPDGRLVAAWREHFAGDVRDVVAAPVPDAAAPPAEPRRVREDDWVYPACPHSGPALGIDDRGRFQVTWFTGKPGAAGVFHARSHPDAPFSGAVELVGGAELPIAHPVAATLTDGGAAIAWDIAPDGARKVLVARVGPDGDVMEQVVVEGSEGADHPRIVPLGSGAVVVAWAVPGERSVARLVRVRWRG